MKRKTKIISGVLLTLVVCIGAVTAWQWNNINAALSFIRYSQDEIDDKLKENDQAIKDLVESLPDVSIRDLTEEEKQALKDGTVTEDQLVDDLLGKNEPKDEPKDEPKEDQPHQQPEPGQSTVTPQPDQSQVTPPPGQSTTEPKPEPPKPEKSEYEEQLSQILARVYVMREQYLTELDKIKDEALAEYHALPYEQRTSSVLSGMAGKYLAIGIELEKECDKKMDNLIVELEALLKANGGDMEIANTVFQTYVNEKSLKKAWYMSELKERGLI